MKIRWIALVAALAIPALGWAASSAKASQAEGCPFPCSKQDCPLKKR